ncbi:MAG TPA: NHL repeat-containing protein [Vicinamibacteria bacterium]|nr:NHL repeat-containing protein [Vicinamibacteria bacterium]
MNAEGTRLARRLLVALALAATTVGTAAAQEPVYVRRLVLPVAEDTIGYPPGVTADLHTGEVFVCDARMNRVIVFDAEGLFLYEMPGGDAFSGPQDVAVDPNGFLVVAASYQRHSAVVELDFDGLFLREVRLSGLPEGAVEPQIGSLAISPRGDRLYLLDQANLRVWITDRDGAVRASIDLAAGLSAKDARDLITGHVDIYGETVLVALPLFSQIRLFDLDGNPGKVVGIRGTAACTLAFPTAAALAGDDELVIVDEQRMLILRWSISSNRCLGEYIGLGDAPGYLYFPMDLALDRSGQLFVAQGFEGRVQMYRGMAPAAGRAAPRRAAP